MKKVDIKNEQRAVLINYLDAKEALDIASKAEKAAKATAKDLFAELGKEYKASEKSDFLTLSLQKQGEVKHVVYTETAAKGAIDWQAYALALGGTPAGAEEYRKAGNTRTSIAWASAKQEAEIAERG